MRVLAAALGIVSLAGFAPVARAQEPAPTVAEGPEPTRFAWTKKGAPVGTLSSGGTDRGAMELALGSATGAVGVTLVILGAIQIPQVRRKEDICQFSDATDCVLDPPGLGKAGIGLSFAFAAPVLVASGLLLAKGIIIHKDWKAVKASENPVAFTGWVDRGTARRRSRGAGFGVRLRF